jgi:hypothetical protein
MTQGSTSCMLAVLRTFMLRCPLLAALVCTCCIGRRLQQSAFSYQLLRNRILNSVLVTPAQDKKEEANWKYHRTERSSTFVRRSLRLPEHADLSKISAK